MSRLGARSMYLLLYCCLLYQTAAHSSVPADLYPELADVVIYNRLQHLFAQMRERELRLQEQDATPPFTYQFGAETNLQSDLFAVPPSDPRYYQPESVIPDAKSEEERDQNEIVSPKESKREEEIVQLVSPDSPPHDTTAATDLEEPAEGVDYVFKTLLTPDNITIVVIAIALGCSAVLFVGVLIMTYTWYRLNNKTKAAADVEYPAYGVTGPNKSISPTGDRRLAESAQMYHYQHQKQQIIAMETNRANDERRASLSEGDSDDENEEGDYTVYECPGLAATGELEVKNPLFQDDPTPAGANHVNEHPADHPDLK